MTKSTNKKKILVGVLIMVVFSVIMTVTALAMPSLTIDVSIKTYTSIVKDGNNIYLAWIDDQYGKNQLYFKKSPDRGSTFDKTVVLAKDIEGQLSKPQISVSGSNLYIAYNVIKTGSFNAIISASNDKGKSFEETLNITRSY